MEKNFQTFTEYMNKFEHTANEEDYIEMIYRLNYENRKVTNALLANKLNVKPASISKMIKKLTNKDLLRTSSSGEILLNKEGLALGKRLYDRHLIIEKFLINLGIKDDLLPRTEIVEHTFDEEMVLKIEDLNEYIENDAVYKKIINKNI